MSECHIVDLVTVWLKLCLTIQLQPEEQIMYAFENNLGGNFAYFSIKSCIAEALFKKNISNELLLHKFLRRADKIIFELSSKYAPYLSICKAYRNVRKFSDTRKLCCNLHKIQEKRPNHWAFKKMQME